jgi:uncharacterized membrane protein YdjX (TVP38/TMEM64 family)|tara:strand:- start:532 stop:912 length:381 start_codon:yes stop_codon:yes gene_type:complete
LILGRVIIFLGVSSFLLTLISNYFDILIHINGKLGVTELGEIWFYFAPNSLQVAETIVSRYIDPCSSLDIFNCSGFIWHPFISSILVLPAAPFFALLSFLLIKLGLNKSYKKRLSSKNKIDPATKV